VRSRAAPGSRERGVFGNRTLNLRAIRAIGYDMDYTLVHYREEQWERRAYEHARRRLAERGWPVGDLEFAFDRVTRGLVVDLELGNLLKATRFGYVVRASHGARVLEFEEQRRAYARTIVDLEEERYFFLNTLFSISEATLFSQLVDRYDTGRLPDVGSYAQLHRAVRGAVDAVHMEGALKQEILAAPERYVVPDPELPPALVDQRAAGKRLLLITNSEWHYVDRILRYCLDPHLPTGTRWRHLFDVVIVGAGKPGFFGAGSPLYEVAEEGKDLLEPAPGGLREGASFHGGSAALVERHIGASGDEILYVGDHVYADVHVSKQVLRWRTALILRELEEEIRTEVEFGPQLAELGRLMSEKAKLEQELCEIQLALQRSHSGGGPGPGRRRTALEQSAQKLRRELQRLDDRVAPLAKASAELGATAWGPLMRAGNDKSLLARQVERYADIYTSRASNLGRVTPFAYLRAPRTTLPHDPG
jgi:HAD superfamily 5'-nucleotidase-like hydrolase